MRSPTSALRSLGPSSPTVSFELFPPRRPELHETIWQRVLRMAQARPDFFSVTYGASGSSREASGALVRRLLNETRVPAVAHLTCVGASREQLVSRVRRLLDAGVRDFVALRGDPPAGSTGWSTPPGGLGRSSELVGLIREVEAERSPGDVVSVAVATYPCGLSHTRRAELLSLKEKQAAGADFAITQVFYEAEAYTSLVSDAHEVGVDLPIVPGVIPLTDRRRLHRLSELTGVVVPSWLDELLEEPDDAERHREGIDATVRLVDDVLAAGAPGLHLYTFNQDRPALDVLERLRADGLRNPAMTDRPTIPVPTHLQEHR